LFSCCLTTVLCGCFGGQIAGVNATAGSLQVSPNSVSFGAVATGTTATTNVYVVNQGSAAVNVSKISVSGQAFSVNGASNLPITVPAGGTYSISVNFVPAGMGADAGQLKIASDATADGTLVVGLSGTGTEASASTSPELTSLSCAFDGATGSAIDNCTVALNSAAGSGGFAVSLSSNDSAVTVPNSVTVQAGSMTASFTAAVSSVNSAQTATLIASAGDVVETFALQLNASGIGQGGTEVPELSGLTCTMGSMTGAGSDGCAVTLSAAAASGGFAVSLASNNAAVVLPASVTVAAGSTSASFTATVSPVSSVQTATLTAGAGNVAETFFLQLNASGIGQGSTEVPELSGLTCTMGSMTGAGSDGCTVMLSAAASNGGFSLSLASNDSAVTVPSSVTVQAGSTTASFTAAVSSVNTTQTATLTASAGGVTETFALQLNASGQTGTALPILTGMTCVSGLIAGAGADSCTVTLNSAATSGGLGVSLSSNDSAVTVPSSVTVQAGSTTASFTAAVSLVNSAQTATLTASAGGVVETFALQLAVQVISLGVSSSSVGFGDVPLNTPATQSLELASTGSATVSISAVIVTGGGFSIPGISFPLILNPNQNVTLNVEFDPTSAGPANGTLTIVSTSLTTPFTTISLSGTGVVGAYEVELSWIAPAISTDPVVGYNIYRSPDGASTYQQMNTSPVTQPAYVDTAVQYGLTYDYIVESVDAAGVESNPSNVAIIPVP